MIYGNGVHNVTDTPTPYNTLFKLITYYLRDYYRINGLPPILVYGCGKC